MGFSLIFRDLIYVLTPFLVHNFYAEEGYSILTEMPISKCFSQWQQTF